MNRKVCLAAALAALTAATLAARLEVASAGVEVCTPACIVVVDVDGLEPKDVTPELTPFLWALAHPDGSHGAGDLNGAGIPLDPDRNGWIWQAGRSSMSAGAAPNAFALLTGGFPEQTGIPADRFLDAQSSFDEARLAAFVNEQKKIEQISRDQHLAVDTILTMIPDQTDEKKKTAAIVGDPAFKPLLASEVDPDRFWAPDPDRPSQYPPSPLLCPVPSDFSPPADQDQGEERLRGGFRCPASDLATMHGAYTILSDTAKGDKVAFTYIYLAELGAAKRAIGDVTFKQPDAPSAPDDGTAPDQPAPRTSEQPPDLREPALQKTLASTDAALAYFVGRLKQNTDVPGQKWRNTVMVVVGNHGYETVPATNRVPAPAPYLADLSQAAGAAGLATDPSLSDLEAWVNKQDTNLKLVPQGTMATVYYKKTESEAPAATRRGVLSNLRRQLLDDGPAGVNGHPLCKGTAYNANGQIPPVIPPGTSGTDTGPKRCIAEVLYADPSLAPEAEKGETVQARHPDWHLDHYDLKKGTRTGVSGDLILIAEPGWAFGRLAGVKGITEITDPIQEISNPNMGSSGGPRNRAVAALVNGPEDIVRQVASARYPVTLKPDTARELRQNPQPKGDLTSVNASPGDDSDDPGHERQPVIVDFLPTLAALMQISVPERQLGGRFLQEAFLRQLFFPYEEEDLGVPDPDPLPPPDPPIEYIQAPTPEPRAIPQRRPSCKFNGLIRRLKAEVTDKDGNDYREAKGGRDMDYIRLSGDFGKLVNVIALTFYSDEGKSGRSSRRVRGKGGRSSRVRGAQRQELKALAQFKPFKLDLRKGLKPGEQRTTCEVRLTLKVPDIFRPTHVGVVVQEARAAKSRSRDDEDEEGDVEGRPNFEGFGPKDGDILSIAGDQNLHERKPGGLRKRGLGAPKSKSGLGKQGKGRKVKSRSRKGKGRKVKAKVRKVVALGSGS